MSRIDQPLKVSVRDGELVIRIGATVLAKAFECAEFNNPFDDKTDDFKKLGQVVFPVMFAREVRDALRHEEEDGSTFVTDMLDKAMSYAFEQGAVSIEEA